MKQKNFIFLTTLLSLICNIHTEYFSIQDGQTIENNMSVVGKSIVKSGLLELRYGGPYYSVSSGSMVQVKSSGVILDLGGFSMENKEDDSKLIVGVEVGFSQAELDADPTLKQVSNVTIKNGCFLNFDVGIIVHKGVNTITIENCSFDDVSAGITFLGIG